MVKKPIFCKQGIVHVPTPHTTHPGINTFGTPADLRISLSNSDTPEYNGRRRFYFDFTGFLDKDIKLFIEGTRRLVVCHFDYLLFQFAYKCMYTENYLIYYQQIRGDRPDRSGKPALKLTDFIDLPKDLPPDNLRIVRDLFGTLIVEEAWKFA
jgi:hypothetical protein